MNEYSHFSAGDTVILRGVWRRLIWWAAPATVVQDTPELTAFYWRAGSPNKIPARRLTPQDVLTLEKVDLVDGTWTGTDVLMLIAPGTAHAVYAMWESGHTRFRCWYVNLQDPLRRTALGFDAMDHFLDIVISPDLSAWRWKDEDEFDRAVEVGLYTPEQASAIRAEGVRVVQRMHEKGSFFNAGWEKWSPPPGWDLPVFPANWDNIV